ncbi:MAG: AraC family ligand binding domain-containing protein [bacterium]
MSTRKPYSAFSKIRQLPDFPGLELLHASYQTHVFPRHWNESFIIQLVEQGVNEFFCEGKTHTAPAGNIVLINAYEVHTGYATGPAPLMYRSLYLTPEFLAEIVGQINEGRAAVPLLAAHVIHDPKLAHFIRKIHRAADQGGANLHLQSVLLCALSHLLRRHSTHLFCTADTGREVVAIRRAREYLHENFHRNISLIELAQHSYLSPFHLLRTFRKSVGMPPHEYLTNLRVERAKQFLAEGIPIAQVAQQTGFIDQSHLHRRFKHFVGLTPGQFLKMSNFVQDCEYSTH